MGTPVSNITVEYNPTFAKVEYAYDAVQNKYLRSTHGDKTIDAATNTQVAVTNIVVVRAVYYSEDTTKGRLGVNLVGNGTATLYSGGKSVELNWSRKDLSSQTEFSDKSGNQMVLQKGNTWFEIVRPTTKVKTK